MDTNLAMYSMIKSELPKVVTALETKDEFVLVHLTRYSETSYIEFTLAKDTLIAMYKTNQGKDSVLLHHSDFDPSLSNQEKGMILANFVHDNLSMLIARTGKFIFYKTKKEMETFFQYVKDHHLFDIVQKDKTMKKTFGEQAFVIPFNGGYLLSSWDEKSERYMEKHYKEQNEIKRCLYELGK